jgi:hypothetical protein
VSTKRFPSPESGPSISFETSPTILNRSAKPSSAGPSWTGFGSACAIQITPPDLNSTTDRIFIPRSALTELTVLGVVGIARRKPAVAAAANQPRLFNE